MKEVFELIHSRYDLVNDLITFGSIRVFKTILFSRAEPGDTCIDIASGTGDNLKYLAKKFKRFICIDPCKKMLEHIRFRFSGLTVTLINEPAENDLKLMSDCVVVTFGFRNFKNTELAMRNISAYLRSGKKLFVMDVFRPSSKVGQTLLDLYFKFVVIPLGGFVTGERSAYEYFRRSVSEFLTFDDFTRFAECYNLRLTWSVKTVGLCMAEFTKI